VPVRHLYKHRDVHDLRDVHDHRDTVANAIAILMHRSRQGTLP
jgi:hypothetical protein